MIKGSWFGFGFGCSMTNCDMVTFESSKQDDEIRVIDLWSRGPYYPDVD